MTATTRNLQDFFSPPEGQTRRRTMPPKAKARTEDIPAETKWLHLATNFGLSKGEIDLYLMLPLGVKFKKPPKTKGRGKVQDFAILQEWQFFVGTPVIDDVSRFIWNNTRRDATIFKVYKTGTEKNRFNSFRAAMNRGNRGLMPEWLRKWLVDRLARISRRDLIKMAKQVEKENESDKEAISEEANKDWKKYVGSRSGFEEPDTEEEVSAITPAYKDKSKKLDAWYLWSRGANRQTLRRYPQEIRSSFFLAGKKAGG